PLEGVDGGEDGGGSGVVFDGPGGEVEAPAVQVDQPVSATRMRLRLGGGGGYGDPRKRDHELVREDVLGGYLSPSTAEEIYGVSLDRDLSVAEV
ncbi:MAG: hydantoinase B/oxoprolinase family protein, partial [Chloroflexota bacterium]|nr:hydantoinase B/oxoprolinase family protein [Chloroflexota bacterium]